MLRAPLSILSACPVLLLTLAVAAPAAAGSGAAAATIDPELAAAVAAAGPGRTLDVLIVLDPPAAAQARQLWRQVRETPGPAPEEALAAALGRRLDEGLAGPLAVLADAERAGRAARIRRLWVAGAIACRLEPDLVARVAARGGGATLLLDRPYDLLGRERPGAPAAPAAAAMTAAPAGPAAPAAPDTAWNVKWVKADRVWRTTGLTGYGVLVAHLDTGVWLTHPDLAGRLWTNPGEIAGNGLDDDGDGYVDDVHGWDFADRDPIPNDDVVGAGGHGTHTAGTVCGDGSGGTVTGCAPGARLLVCKVFYSDGSGAPFSAIWEARQYALARRARVLTMSAGAAGAVPELLLRVERLTSEVMREAGLVAFNSAGNEHLNDDPPEEIGITARVPAPWNAIPGIPYTSLGGVIAVGGTGYQSDAVYALSSQGPVTWSAIPPWNDWPYLPGAGLIKPDLAAPGVNVNSTLPPVGYSGDTWSGTSMACPHAAGVAALLLQRNPSLSPAGVDSILERTAVDLGAAGKDNVFGSGLIDALAAVAAVPTSYRPLLAWRRTAYDPEGDDSLDPGETADLRIELVNNSAAAGATSITGTLVVPDDPYLSVVDAAGSWPNLLPGGAAAFNADDPFRLAAAPGAPVGHLGRALLTVTASQGWQQTFDLELRVGNPPYRTHDLGGVLLTVTDQGILGYLDDSLLEGQGFGDGFTGLSDLFLGSFWGGTGPGYVCSRDYPGSGPYLETFEWVAAPAPAGRVREIGGAGVQTFSTVFTDGGHPSSVPVFVNLTSRSRSAAADADYVLLSYTVTNQGTSTLPDYCAGIFCDFDIGTYDGNEGGTDPARHLTWMRGDGGVCCGIALIQPAAHRNLTLINNPDDIYPYNTIDDDTKSRLLKGSLSLPATTGPDDWSALTSAGGGDLAPGQSRTYVFALLRARDLAGLQRAADRAALTYPTGVPAESPPRPRVALPPNRPNPFNPRTEIRFDLPRRQTVRLEVHDLAGRLLRVLVDGELAAGPHVQVWDGRDGAGAACPSGLYVARLRAGNQLLSRKMTLLR